MFDQGGVGRHMAGEHRHSGKIGGPVTALPLCLQPASFFYHTDKFGFTLPSLDIHLLKILKFNPTYKAASSLEQLVTGLCMLDCKKPNKMQRPNPSQLIQTNQTPTPTGSTLQFPVSASSQLVIPSVSEWISNSLVICSTSHAGG